MKEIYNKGLTPHLSISNMTIPKLEAVLQRCKIKPELIEMEQHPSFQQQALFDYCKEAERNCRLVKGQVFLWPGAKGWEDLWDIDGKING